MSVRLKSAPAAQSTRSTGRSAESARPAIQRKAGGFQEAQHALRPGHSSYEAQRDALRPRSGAAVQRQAVQRVPDEHLNARTDESVAAPAADSCPDASFTEAQIRAEIATYTPAPAGLGPWDILDAFVNNDPSVPVRASFGPDEPMTKRVRYDAGVDAARAKFLKQGRQRDCYVFGALDFLRETIQLDSTTHMLGSYTINIAPTADGRLLFAVYNSTTLESLTRSPITRKSPCQNRERDTPADQIEECDIPYPQSVLVGTDRATANGFGNIHQVYWWEEARPAPETSPRYLRSPDGTSIDTQTGEMIMGPGPKY